MGTGEINGHLWKHILKQQLQITQEYFNSEIWNFLKLYISNLIYYNILL